MSAVAATLAASAASVAASAPAFLPASLQDWISVFKDAATAVAVLVGGGWVLWRYLLQREARPKIQFDVQLELVGRLGTHVLVEVVATVENKGLVRHPLKDLRFDLHYLPENALVKRGDDRINGQVLFQSALKRVYWVPADWLGTFVDPGVTQRYSYIAALPADAAFALLFAQFKYPGTANEYHLAQRAFNLRKPASSGEAQVENDG